MTSKGQAVPRTWTKERLEKSILIYLCSIVILTFTFTIAVAAAAAANWTHCFFSGGRLVNHLA